MESDGTDHVVLLLRQHLKISQSYVPGSHIKKSPLIMDVLFYGRLAYTMWEIYFITIYYL